MEPRAESLPECFLVSSPSLSANGEARWETLVRQYQGGLRKRIWRLLERLGQPVNRELVEEIVQDVYCRLLLQESLRRWRGRTLAELLGYVGTIADRTVFDHLRVAQTGQRHGIREVRMGRRLEQLPDPRQNPERDLLQAETRRLVLRRCHDASARAGRRRNVWVARLALLEGWTNREIAGAAGGRLSPGNVACLVHRLRRRLVREGLTPRRWKRRRAV
jgi:RNA polymerase sigma factor (sigma-70 family)